MYSSWKRRERGGLTRLQNSYLPLYERTRTFRTYASDMVPGTLQTHDYAQSLFATLSRFRGVPDDSERAAAARVERSRIMQRPGRRTFAFLPEEAVSHHRTANAQVMSGQLTHLLAVMTYPQVSIGIIPFAVSPVTAPAAGRCGRWKPSAWSDRHV
ncbi:Scr1 family TA system antitoxin-like transcriptional regulator [Embleya sp. NPDC127516]|uniref:Scr1 family TA system antitoxin-like transcriptional regulator n=1 Tax=Embleya sp. NPDC127516 TaxID=3363990 RepID=UPI00382EFEF8